MYSEQYENRKHYVEAVKNSFSAARQTERSKDTELLNRNIPEKEHRSFIGVRFILSLVLLLIFLAIKQTDFSWKGWNAEKIISQIQYSVDLSKIMEQIRFLP